MKQTVQSIGFLVLITTLFFSCNNGKPLPEEDTPKAIGFAVDQLQTRGSTITDPDDILSLGIFGYSTGSDNFDPNSATALPNIFWSTPVERTDANSDWVYDPVAYWPMELSTKNTFFAYSPFFDRFPEDSFHPVSDPSDPGPPMLYYRVPEDLSDHVDLLYSVLNSDVENINHTTNDGKVKYTMRHALLWIRFLVAPMAAEASENEDPNAYYTIFEFNMFGNLATSGTFNMATGRWTLGNLEDVYYVFDKVYDNHLDVRLNEIKAVSDNCLMLIPQNITSSENDAYINLMFRYNSDGTPGGQNDTEFYITAPFPDVNLGGPKLDPDDGTTSGGSVMTYIVRLSRSGVIVEFHSTNTIEEWLENLEEREITVF